MKKRAGMRELFTLEGSDAPVRGTYHKPAGGENGFRSHSIQTRNIGILFLNSLSPTRAAHGDSAVFWADSFAQAGYPAIRIDLPGFGDSAGEPPPELLRFINTGSYAGLVAAKTSEVAERFGLSGVVIVGLCAGAVSAVFSASAAKECKGLILLDPYFHLPFKPRSKLWYKLTGRISRSLPGRLTIAGYSRMKTAWRALLGDLPPENANLPLLDCWRSLSANGLPMLVFKAAGATANGEFDYLAFLRKKAGRNSQLAVKTIEGAGHTFSNAVGRETVRCESLDWLNVHFSQAEREDGVTAKSGQGRALGEVLPESANMHAHA